MSGKVINDSRVSGNEVLLHTPDIFVPRIILDEGQYPDESHLAALMAGQAVLAHCVIGQRDSLTNARCLEVAEDKQIEPGISSHQVGFGAFSFSDGPLRHPAGSGKKKLKLPVALKPHSCPRTALHELGGYLTLAELDVETFTALAVYPAKAGEHFVLVTKKRNHLTSLDRDEWIIGRQVFDEESAKETEHNNDTITGIAKVGAYINSRAVYHRDGQIKNYAKTQNGKVGVIDTEKLIVGELNDESSVDYAWDSIEMLVKSLVINTKHKPDVEVFGVGMFYGLPLEVLRQAISELIIEPYLDTLGEQLSGDVDRNDHVARLYEGIYSKFFNDHEWPGHLLRASHKQHDLVTV